MGTPWVTPNTGIVPVQCQDLFVPSRMITLILGVRLKAFSSKPSFLDRSLFYKCGSDERPRVTHAAITENKHRIEGTLRTTASEVRDRLADLLQDGAHATELLFGTLIEIEITKVAPVTLNDPTCVAAAIAAATRAVGVDRVVENARSLMASEDFSELSRLVPGAYFFVGQGGYAPHHPKFIFDPEIIPVGAAIFADLAKHRTSKSLNSRQFT